jgi:hypothetical protein
MSGQKIIDGLNEAITFAKAIAEATAMERERCAMIADAIVAEYREHAETRTANTQRMASSACAHAANRVAEAIRNPTTEAS